MLNATGYQFKNLQIRLVAILIFLMFAIPQNLQWFKIVVILIIYFLYIGYALKETIKVDKAIINFMVCYLTYAILAFVIGAFRGNPGVYDFLRVNITYYVMLFIMILCINQLKDFIIIIKAVILASNFISIYTLLLLFVNLGIWPKKYFYMLDNVSAVGIHEGYSHITNTNLSMLIFIFPLLLLLINNSYVKQFISQKYLIISCIAASVVIILSGRRVLWIVIFFSFFVFIMFINSTNNSILKKILTIAAISLSLGVVYYVTTNIYIFSLDAVIKRLFNVFQKTDEYNNSNVRLDQIAALFKGFLNYPIFGSGAGIGVEDSIRSYSRPWTYEMSYNLILYNSGIFGSIIYVMSMLIITLKLWKEAIKKNKIALAILVAFLSGLFASGTNPYITSSFDFLIFIFLPLMYINVKDKNLENG